MKKFFVSLLLIAAIFSFTTFVPGQAEAANVDDPHFVKPKPEEC